MGSLQCPLCCRRQFASRKELQAHLLEIVELLHCPSCRKNFSSIMGLVQHLSLSSCSVDINVDFDSTFVTYVDCRFLRGVNKLQEYQAKLIPQHYDVIEEVELILPNIECDEATEELVDYQDSESTVDNQELEYFSGPDELSSSIKMEPCSPEISHNKTEEIVEHSAKVEYILTRHQDRHKMDKNERKTVSNTRKKNKEENEAKNFKCKECGKPFKTQSKFDSHSCNILICDVCGTQRKSQHSLKLHKKLHEREALELQMNRPCTETYTCEECGETMRASLSEAHSKMHHSGLKIFHCKLCSSSYLSMTNLNIHLNSHGESKSYQCEICSKEFKTSSYLKTHLEIHTNAKPYKCSYCDQLYHRKWDCLKHELIHTGERPLSCEICGKSFRVQYCLKLHMRTHTNERPYTCEVCKKKFKSHSVLAHHSKLHLDARPYKCPYCVKTFKTSVAMIGHKNIHEKPHSCPTCNRRFASKYDVKLHMAVHEKGEKRELFKCTICNAVYARNHALVDHLREHKEFRREESYEYLENISLQGLAKDTVTASEEEDEDGDIEEEAVTEEIVLEEQVEEVTTEILYM